MKNLLFLLLILLSANYLTAQKGTIRGTVFDDVNNEPLICATVLVVGSTNGAITDLDG